MYRQQQTLEMTFPYNIGALLQSGGFVWSYWFLSCPLRSHIQRPCEARWSKVTRVCNGGKELHWMTWNRLWRHVLVSRFTWWGRRNIISFALPPASVQYSIYQYHVEYQWKALFKNWSIIAMESTDLTHKRGGRKATKTLHTQTKSASFSSEGVSKSVLDPKEAERPSERNLSCSSSTVLGG